VKFVSSFANGRESRQFIAMRERVEQMNGQLEITSVRGRGTNVVVALPLNQESILVT
jgi:signal transduction histidine kinase